MSTQTKQVQTNGQTADQSKKALASIKVTADQRKKALASITAQSALLPVERMTNIADAELLFRTANGFDLVTTYKRAVIIATVDKNEWYKQAGFKTVIGWATAKFGIAKSQCYNYINAAKYIAVDGSKTLYEFEGKAPFNDYSIAHIAEVFIPNKIGLQQVEEMTNKGDIAPSMTVKQLKTAILKANAIDIDDRGKIQTANDGNEQTDKKVTAKTTAIKLSFEPDNAVKKVIKGIPQGAFVIVYYNNTVTKLFESLGQAAKEDGESDV